MENSFEALQDGNAVFGGTVEPICEDKGSYEEHFTPEELNIIGEYAGRISITDENILAGYGLAVQKKSTDLAAAAVIGAEAKDDSYVLELAEKLVGLIGEMEASESDKSGILGLFKTKGGRLAELSEKYERTEPVADELMLALDSSKDELTADVKTLSDLYDISVNCIKELTMYIAAGKMKLKSERDVTLVKICEFAKNSGDAADVEAAASFAEMCRRFGERIVLLEQTCALVKQAAPKLLLLRNNCAAMCEMISEVNGNALSVWKRHAASALGIDKVGSAVKMPGNAFDREFLRTINTEMISFIDYVTGKYKAVGADRVRAGEELRAIECELRQLLIAAAGQK